MAYYFFWGSDSVFSNFYQNKDGYPIIADQGLLFKTSEHYYMWRKAMAFKDFVIADRILKAQTPRDAKALGRQVKGFDEAVWTPICYQVMKDALKLKFGQNDDLKVILLGTRGKILVEASPYDQIWGIGLAESDELAQNEATWKGQNLLGKCLDEVRMELDPKEQNEVSNST
jgi:ribA/ribD-fused uncharacterized protein